jgi:hypothetical protein
LHVFRVRRDVLVYGLEVGLGHHVSINCHRQRLLSIQDTRSGGADFGPQARTTPRASNLPASGAYPSKLRRRYCLKMLIGLEGAHVFM